MGIPVRGLAMTSLDLLGADSAGREEGSLMKKIVLLAVAAVLVAATAAYLTLFGVFADRGVADRPDRIGIRVDALHHELVHRGRLGLCRLGLKGMLPYTEDVSSFGFTPEEL